MKVKCINCGYIMESEKTFCECPKCKEGVWGTMTHSAYLNFMKLVNRMEKK